MNEKIEFYFFFKYNFIPQQTEIMNNKSFAKFCFFSFHLLFVKLFTKLIRLGKEFDK